MGHSICIHAFVHVGHTRSLWVHVDILMVGIVAGFVFANSNIV